MNLIVGLNLLNKWMNWSFLLWTFEREREGEIDRPTDGQTDRQVGGWTNQTDRQ